MLEFQTYADLPSFHAFHRVTDPDVYAPLPDDWLIGLSDVVGSTKALEAGGYKAVNMAGASLISAMLNALPDTAFPFAFGGDGAAFAVPPGAHDVTRDTLARTAAWVRDELDLTLRVALVSVAEIREAGHDVRVARFQVSDGVAYAMFSGGGLNWAESEMKLGRFGIEPGPRGSRPDLEGLSCRWTPLQAGDGVILSLIACPALGANTDAYARFVRDVLDVAAERRAGHPVPEQGPGFVWPPAGLDFEARATRGDGSLGATRRKLLLITFIAWVLDRIGLSLGQFNPITYRRDTALNTDFRKFDDGLRMTLKCTHDDAERIEALCASSAETGTIRYGAHRQDAALMTCIVPSIVTNTHMHFLDGAGGGYAMAARQMKRSDQATGAT